MSQKVVPEAILDAVVVMLVPYFPGVTATKLVEVLVNRNKTTTASPTLRKPLTRREAAAILQVSLATINRRLRDGSLKASKIGRLVRISPSSLEMLLTEREITSTVEA